jgi:hypothetical protein
LLGAGIGRVGTSKVYTQKACSGEAPDRPPVNANDQSCSTPPSKFRDVYGSKR